MSDAPSKPRRPRPIGSGLASAIARKIRKAEGLPNGTRPASQRLEPGINVTHYGSFGKRDITDPEAIVTVTEFGEDYTNELMDRVVALLEPHYFLRNRTRAKEREYMIYHTCSVVVSKKEHVRRGSHD